MTTGTAKAGLMKAPWGADPWSGCVAMLSKIPKACRVRGLVILNLKCLFFVLLHSITLFHLWACACSRAYQIHVCGCACLCTCTSTRVRFRGRPQLSLAPKESIILLLGVRFPRFSWNSLIWLDFWPVGSRGPPASNKWMLPHLPFYLDAGNQTEVLKLVWQTFYTLSYLPHPFKCSLKKKQKTTVFILYKQVQYSVFLWSLTKWFRLNFTKTSGLPCKSIVIIFSTPAQDFPQFLLRSKHLELNTDSLFCWFF